MRLRPMNAQLPGYNESALPTIVLDAMGGDQAPHPEIQGALLAIGELRGKARIVLVGKEDNLKMELPDAPPDLTIVHAPDVITMDDEPSTIVKSRKESSLYVGLDMVRAGKAQAFVSAGNTGAVMATATMLCGRIDGVSRPTIGSFFPTSGNHPTLVLDVGANVGSKARFLHDYAVMGSVYYRLMMNEPSPTVGLLNVGEEHGKGTDTVKETFSLLESANINFAGNVEGRDILNGKVHIVVCDGFEGNIILKFAESVLGFLRHRFMNYANKGLVNKLRMAALKPVLKSVLKDMDYQTYGGVPLLGVNGVVVIGHGSSSPVAIKNMIIKAFEVVRNDVNGNIRQALMPQQQESHAQ